jgi:hypothetical protein
MKRLLWLLVAISILAVLFVGACGGNGGDEETTQTTEATTTTEETTTEETTTEETSNGGGGSGGFTWNDVPIYGGADEIQEFNISIPPDEGEYSRVEWRYYETGDDVNDVVDFYKDKMPDNGWEEMMWMDAMEIAYGMYMKNNEADAAMIWVATDNGDTVIGLWRASE